MDEQTYQNQINRADTLPDDHEHCSECNDWCDCGGDDDNCKMCSDCQAEESL